MRFRGNTHLYKFPGFELILKQRSTASIHRNPTARTLVCACNVMKDYMENETQNLINKRSVVLFLYIAMNFTRRM